MKPDYRIEAANSIANPHKNDIFISYSSADKEFVEGLDNAIREQGRDPWVDWEDIPEEIQTEAERQQCITTGVFEADTFVFIVSSGSINHQECRRELDLAIEYGRCLIFILCQGMNKATNDLLELKHSNWLSSNETDPDNFAQLARAIVNIQIYSRLLIRSNQWCERGCSKDFLLRGRDLIAVRKWIDQTRKDELRLTPDQQQYIDASYEAESKRPKQTDVFISYSRKDKNFAEKLYTLLKKNNLNPWIDWENIPVAVDWWQEIEEGIEASHTFVFIVSPSSISSPYCQAEIAHAIKHGKRLIPVEWEKTSRELWREIFDVDELVHIRKRNDFASRKQRDVARNSNSNLMTLRDIGENLKKYQWYHVHASTDSDTLQNLLNSIKNVPEYIKSHTRLLLRAIEWENNGYKEDFLLRKSDLKAAKQWLTKSKLLQSSLLPFEGQDNDLATHFVPLQEQYIQASDKAESASKRNKTLLILLISAIVASLSWFTLATAKGEITALVSSLEETEELDSLIRGIIAGRKLQHWSRLIELIDPSLQVRGVTALQQEVYGLRELNRLSRHEEEIFDVSFSPDANRIASASGDNTVKLWTFEGKQIKSLEGHRDDVLAVVFNPDGQTLISASKDGVIKLWSRDGEELWTSNLSERHQDRINSISYSPGGDRFASASRDGTVKVWTHQGELVATLPHTRAGKAVTSVAFSPPYGDRVASAGFDGTVKIWTRNGALISTSQHGSQVISISYSPNGQFIASAGYDGTLKLWNQDGRLIRVFEGHQDNETKVIHRVVFSPDGQSIATAGGDGLIRLWDRENGELRYTLQEHQGAVYRVQFSSNGQTIATAGADGVVRLWSSNNGDLLERFEGHRDQVLDINFAEDKPVLMSAGQDRTIRLWKLNNPIKVLPHDNRVYDVSFSPDGRTVASSSVRSIRLWRENAIPLDALTGDKNQNLSGDIFNISFSPNGQTLASVGANDKLALWKVDGARISQLAVVAGHQGDIYSVSFRRDGQLLASAGEDGTIKLWKLDNNRLIQVERLERHQRSVRSLSFSPDGQFLGSADEDGTIELWKLDGDNITHFRSIKGHDDLIHSVSFSPDSQLLASASADTTIRLWNLQGKLIKTLNEENSHTDEVLKVSFSPYGNLLASASRDGTVKIWTRRGSLITTLKQHEREVSSVSFSPVTSDPDTITLASSSFDNKVLLWRLPRRFDERALEELLNAGCESAQDFLETNERIEPDLRKFCQRMVPSQPDKEIVESVN